MPQTTNYEIITSIASSTLPTLSPVETADPTAAAHAVNRAWLEEKGFDRDAIHEPVQTVANAKAITAAVRTDKVILLIEDKAAIYYFDSSSAHLLSLILND